MHFIEFVKYLLANFETGGKVQIVNAVDGKPNQLIKAIDHTPPIDNPMDEFVSKFDDETNNQLESKIQQLKYEIL